MRILKEQTASLIIDIQERLLPHMVDSETLIANNRILIQGMKNLDIPLLVTQQYTKALGDTVPPIKEITGDLKHIEKISFSCCDETDFMEKLKKLNKKFIIITGIESHVCVLQTVIDLIENKFIPVIVADCISSRKTSDKLMALERIKTEGGILTTYESILFELTRYAGTEVFKSISKLVK